MKYITGNPKAKTPKRTAMPMRGLQKKRRRKKKKGHCSITASLILNTMNVYLSENTDHNHRKARRNELPPKPPATVTTADDDTKAEDIIETIIGTDHGDKVGDGLSTTTIVSDDFVPKPDTGNKDGCVKVTTLLESIKNNPSLKAMLLSALTDNNNTTQVIIVRHNSII